MGPDSFDCSGLVITSISDVLGRASSNWPQKLRHVREIWAAAQEQQHNLQTAEFAVGALLVTRRNYTINGQPQVVAGHIGIITSVNEAGLNFIHASPTVGKVEERPLKTQATTLGCVLLDKDFAGL